MLSDQALAELLEAASKDWQVHAPDSMRVCDGSHDSGFGCEAILDAEVLGRSREEAVAIARLAALAPDLAQEVLDRRRVGGELAEAMEEYERMWEAANACPECVGSLCADHALKLILARTTAKDALARWAELAETEVR